ncbi:protein FAR1-RELATED SEQUENCE 5-like [Impatiens glandulifera]|uniref:protein FAR1-RELATED SEQUENCE 5-like n=1 Tax=Impatiens glandulifera TaxID=253017 RepID=UPI001FB08BE2|nr:protein FAR1-RELATED SEQUENCE 5-like [Impatiens glandulifera]
MTASVVRFSLSGEAEGIHMNKNDNHDLSVSASCRCQLNFDENDEPLEDITTNLIPYLGREFEREEDAYKFYLAYAKIIGFGIRHSSKHDDKDGFLLDKVFCCSTQGERGKDKHDVYVKRSRSLTRFGCEEKLRIKRAANRKFEVITFISEHCHPLASPKKTHLYKCHRNISVAAGLHIEMANNVGIPPKASHALMAKQIGGGDNLGFIP